MRIPSDKTPQGLFERDELYREVAEICFKSHERRKGNYELLKNYYLYGCPPEYGATPYNKIYPTLDTVTAFLYSADTTRFSCEMPSNVPSSEWDKAPAVARKVSEEWKSSNGDLTFGRGLEWALVYGSTIVKLVPRGAHVAPFVIEPHDFGVYREDVNELDRQEAMCHRYWITRSQLERELERHPRQNEILSKLQAQPVDKGPEMPDMLRRIIITNTSNGVGPISPGNTVTGAAAIGLDGRIEYVPAPGADLIQMEELWIMDDDTGDWRVVTRADSVVTVYDRPNIFVAGDHPFGHICPDPQQGYFWGRSWEAPLIGLQQFRNERMDQVRDLLAKQVKPPTALEAFTGALDEIDFALNKAGGVLPLQDPMSKVQRFAPQVPEDVFAEVRFIDEMFAEASGLHNLLMGRGETGVRSGRQTNELARLGSSRIKKRALIIEDSLDAIVTKYYVALRKYDDTTLTYKSEGEERKFTLKQVPKDACMKVDAHSNSPLFTEDQKQLAAQLFESKAITRSRLIEMTSPPSKEVILRELADLEKKEAAAAQMQAAAQAKPKPQQ